MKKQSSIQYLLEKLEGNIIQGNQLVLELIIDQAKEMHKQEIIEAHCDWNRIVDKLPSRSADEYYKNTYEKEN